MAVGEEVEPDGVFEDLLVGGWAGRGEGGRGGKQRGVDREIGGREEGREGGKGGYRGQP